MKPKILIVEDDDLTKKFYNYVFSTQNLDVIQLEDGDEIFRVLKHDEFSLIIMDINLKNTKFEGKSVDGTFLTKRIKTDNKLKNIPLVLVSAYNQDRRLIENCFADGYYQKPIVDFNDFLNKMMKLIER